MLLSKLKIIKTCGQTLGKKRFCNLYKEIKPVGPLLMTWLQGTSKSSHQTFFKAIQKLVDYLLTSRDHNDPQTLKDNLRLCLVTVALQRTGIDLKEARILFWRNPRIIFIRGIKKVFASIGSHYFESGIVKIYNVQKQS